MLTYADARRSQAIVWGDGRTLTDVLQDVLRYIRICKKSKNRVPGNSEFRNDDMRGEGGGGLGSNRSLAELGDETMAVGLLSSTQLYLLEVEVPGLIVGRISTASHALFRHHPRDHGMVGECLLSTWWASVYCRHGGRVSTAPCRLAERESSANRCGPVSERA